MQPDAPERRIVFDVRGMTCASCVSSVTRALRASPGVRDAEVNFATHEATVVPGEGFDADAAARAVASVGAYELRTRAAGAPPADAEDADARALGRDALASCVLAAAAMALSMGWVPG